MITKTYPTFAYLPHGREGSAGVFLKKKGAHALCAWVRVRY